MAALRVRRRRVPARRDGAAYLRAPGRSIFPPERRTRPTSSTTGSISTPARAANCSRRPASAAGEATIAPGWTLVFAPQRIACMKLMTLAVPAARGQGADRRLSRARPACRVLAHAYRARRRATSRKSGCRSSSLRICAKCSLRDRSDSRAASWRRGSCSSLRRRGRPRKRPAPNRCPA